MIKTKKKVVFVTGTRADYGKMKPLMRILENDPQFAVSIFVCGMHLSPVFGSTYEEVIKDGYKDIHVAYGLPQTDDACVNLGSTITYMSGYIENVKPDMVIVHGDRMDALAGAIVGALHNVLVGHIEGGELSGTLDESIRHAVSKFAHIHLVSTDDAKKRLLQLGEEKSQIYTIGSPDIDIMMRDDLPSISDALARYEIPFSDYGLCIYHPVTTEFEQTGKQIHEVVNAMINSNKNFIVIYPNNDLGSEIILNEYERLRGVERFKLFPSVRFEYFLTMLKNTSFMIGNSSAGIREASVYCVPVVDIGSRQSGRYNEKKSENIIHVEANENDILKAIRTLKKCTQKRLLYGNGNSAELFLEAMCQPEIWETKIQKRFVDIENM